MEILKFAPLIALATLVITIILYIVVMPRSKDGSLGNFGQFLHNFFHFKKLYVESLLKFIYVLCTVGIFCAGIYFTIIGFIEGIGEFVLYGLLALIIGPIAFRLGYEFLMMGILLVKNVIDINNKLPNNARCTAPVQSAAPVAPAAPKAAPVVPVQPAAPKAESAAPKATPAPAAPKAAAKAEPAPAAPVQPAAPAAPKAPPAPFCTVCGSRNNPDGTCPNHCSK